VSIKLNELQPVGSGWKGTTLFDIEHTFESPTYGAGT
jgi:hypothetical protein